MYNSKLSLLEEVLNVSLTPEQEDVIHHGWRAFWDDPESFKDDVVIDMVLLDLGLTPNDTKKEEVKVKEDTELEMEISLLGIPGLEIKHFAPCDTLAWGKLRGCPIYVRKVDRMQLIPYYDGRPETFDELSLLVDETDYAAIVFQSQFDYIIYVMHSNYFNHTGSMALRDLCPTDYQYAGVVRFSDGVEEHDESKMNFVKKVYVPFNKGSNNSMIPIMWDVTGSKANFDNRASISSEKFNDIVSDGAVSIDVINSIFADIKEALPSVDLESSPKDARYSCVWIEGVSNSSVYAYNRNHVAYNGNTDSMKAIICMVLDRLSSVFQSIAKCNIGEYINNNIDQDEIVISFIGHDAPVKQETSTANGDDSRKLSDNPLLRAAQRGDTRYK